MGFFELLAQSMPLFLKGMQLTLELSFVSLAIAMVIGVVASLMGMSNVPLFRAINGAFVAIIRGTPLLVQGYFIYFGLTGVL